MFGISYDTWKSVCDMYFSLNAGSQKAYLQWFPFTKLSSTDKETISGKDFYDNYIKTASFMLFPPAMHQSENYLQKGDGSFRDSSLVAPVLFLFLQSIGLEIHNHYSSIRPSDISVYYAGNYKHLRPKYKQDYDEYFNGQKHNIEELFSGALYRFLNDLSLELLLDSIDIERYNELINKHFSSDDIEFTPSEVFNYYVYENEDELKSEPVVKEIVGLVEQSISFISLDPKRLTVMIMKTQNDRAIKGFLNQLFRKNRSDKWNSYDTTIAISYLIQSKFRHIDLLDILSNRHPNLYSYYFHHCKSSTTHCFDLWRVKKLAKIIALDSKAHYLYFMHLCEMKRENYMAAFAYYKNYFDRVTADLDFSAGNDPSLRKPNYNMFYKEGMLIRFYSGVDDSKTVIEKAHKLRNANPLSHASSGLLDSNDTSEDLCESIKALSKLIYGYVAKHKEQA